MAKIHINFHITNPYSEKLWILGSGWGKFLAGTEVWGGMLLGAVCFYLMRARAFWVACVTSAPVYTTFPSESVTT